MSQASVIALEKSTFYLNGLHCANCAAKIETAIHEEQSFEDVNFSFATKKLQLKSVMEEESLQLKIQGIVDAIEDGVIVDRVKHHQGDDCTTGSCAVEVTEASKKEHPVWKLVKANWSMLIGAVIVFTLIFTKPVNVIALPAYLLAYVLIGGDVASGAIKHLLKGNLFDENFLMTLATFGALPLENIQKPLWSCFFIRWVKAFRIMQWITVAAVSSHCWISKPNMPISLRME